MINIHLALSVVIICGTIDIIYGSREVHAFYYLWYGDVKNDGDWKHWNHEVLPHWTPKINALYPNIGTKFTPPQQLHSPFYPLFGPYSSKDPAIIRKHFELIKQYGIDVIVISWWGQCDSVASTDTQGVCTDTIVPILFEIADEVGNVSIAFHMEPYHGRNITSIRNDIIFIHNKYSNYTSFYKSSDHSNKPMYYIYDSYHISPNNWKQLLTPSTSQSIRNTIYDGIFIGLWLDSHHGEDLKLGGFDGAYTYFASNGFSYGSNIRNWKHICNFCISNSMICVPSVGPGYDDSKIRPWNSANAKTRDNGKYYDMMWKYAIDSNPQV
jgi:hypothetical protein